MPGRRSGRREREAGGRRRASSDPTREGGHRRYNDAARDRSPNDTGRGGNTRDGCRVRYFNYGSDHREDCDGGDRRREEELSTAPKPDEKTLQVEACDLKFKENGRAHHTWRYEISWNKNKSQKLVVRRGQPFDIELKFNKEYDPRHDDLTLVFEADMDAYGKPNPVKGTLVDFTLSDKDTPKEWGAKIVSNKGTNLTVSVFTPPTLFVGKWKFSVEVVKKGETTVDIYTYDHKEPIYIIFNPFCKDDSVYLDDEDQVNEYCLKDYGRIYCGNSRRISSRPWNFGQYESCVLDCALFLLDKGELAWTSRGNPIAVVRKLSAVVNSNDEGGVLVGNWSGDYDDGKSPSTWTGSVAILEDYWKNWKPVKFGQCWVFSGVCTTIGRALGIPTRSVTNFASAHDTDGSVTIDVIFDENGEKNDWLTDDSIWNFHVWNESWMARPDLPAGFGGWQAFDATPQETSTEGTFACGPVSVQAIKQGELNLLYDAPFVFAEVNADRMYWSPTVGGKLECIGCDEKTVGRFISTTMPKSWMRLDITNNYKPAEGSAEERAAVLRANQMGSSRADLYDKSKTKDVTFTVKQDSENTWVGGDFEVLLHMRNDSKEDRTVSGRMAVSSMYYTGVVSTKLKSEPFRQIKLKPGEEQEHKVKVTCNEYDGKLKDCCMLDMSVWAVVKETNQHYTSKDDFRLRKPHLTIKAPDVIKALTEFEAEVSFVNPMDCPLTRCSVTVDGLVKPLEFSQGNVGAKGTFLATLPITPKKLGHTELILSFNSAQLEDINGSHPIFIQE